MENNTETPDHIKLQEPANHDLPSLLRALKWGRPSHDQKLLLNIADAIESGDITSASFKDDDMDEPLGEPCELGDTECESCS